MPEKENLQHRLAVDRIISTLIDEKHWMPNSSFINNFFLTYRFFVHDPMKLFTILLGWFNQQDSMKEKVAKLIIRWIDQNLSEFEANETLFDSLVSFIHALKRENMIHFHDCLVTACSRRSHFRTVSVSSKVLQNSGLRFVQNTAGVFISSDQYRGRIANFGFMNGDQILEVNGITLNDSSSYVRIDSLVKTSSICVMRLKWNPSELDKIIRGNHLNVGNSKFYGKAVPVSKNGSILRHSNSYNESKVYHVNNEDNKRTSKCMYKETSGNDLTDRITKLLKKLGYDSNGIRLNNQTGSDSKVINLSRSNPDLSVHAITNCGITHGTYAEPEILKIYRSDQSYVFLPVFKSTTAQNVVQLALHDFGLTAGKFSSLDWALCKVTCEKSGAIVQKRLSNNVQNLADRLPLNSRYYLKSLKAPEALLPDELAQELYDDSRTDFLRLEIRILAACLTLRDFQHFSLIKPVDYVEDLLKSNVTRKSADFPTNYRIDSSEESISKILSFEDTVNQEMWWVATEVCNERSASKRARSLKKFIKLANRCRELQNFNSTFAIVSGLEKPAVKRLKSTWERLSSKYRKIFQKMQLLLDPSRNMAKYRASLDEATKNPPVLPIFPLIRKDLYFLNECNKTWIDDEFVNWEKMNMIAEKLRSLQTMTSKPYVISEILDSWQYDRIMTVTDYSLGTHLQSSARRTAFCRRICYEKDIMIKKCKAYLDNLQVMEDEAAIESLSLLCQPSSQNETPSERNRRRRQPNISRSDSSCGSLYSVRSGVSTICSISTENSPSLLHATRAEQKTRQATHVNIKNGNNPYEAMIHIDEDVENNIEISNADPTYLFCNLPKTGPHNLRKAGSPRPLLRESCFNNSIGTSTFDPNARKPKSTQIDQNREKLEVVHCGSLECETDVEISHV